jgi:uncharacterized membrane protein
MTRLIAGVLLWSLMHFIPVAATGLRQRLIGSMGEKPYKTAFGVVMVFAVFLIISGWKAAVPEAVYTPISWAGPVALLLVLVGLILFVAPYPANNVQRILRNPQLTGVVLWAIAHLMANGDSRSLVLFGGMGLWAIIEIILTNRRDGAWQKPEAAPVSKDIGMVVFAAGLFALLLFTHEYLFGVPLPIG